MEQRPALPLLPLLLMWLKIIEFLLSSGSYFYSFWQKVRQKQAIESELKAEEIHVEKKTLTEDDATRKSAMGDANFLHDPDRPNGVD